MGLVRDNRAIIFADRKMGHRIIQNGLLLLR
jgi:hypothetical protein